MMTPKEALLRLPAAVVDDVQGYGDQVSRYLSGETSAVVFRAYRVPMGVYEQRESGKFMVRIRIGAGLARPAQIRAIADLADQYSTGAVHVTTRQDIQIHQLRIEDTVKVMAGLLRVQLCSRGGGGNTVRNVSACPRSGTCPREHFDVAPSAIATAEYLLQDRSSFNLPRKYKIAFSGCADDCAYAAVADLGLFATARDGVQGFKAYAGGGLGSNPRAGILIESFITAAEVIEVAQAIKQLFDKHGDRKNKHKARLRYVLSRVGDEEFLRLYREELDAVRAKGLEGDIPQIRPLAEEFDALAGERSCDGTSETEESGPFLKDGTPGFYTAEINLPLGDISCDELRAVADVAESEGCNIVRTTQRQNLMIPGIAESSLAGVKQALAGLAVQIVDSRRPPVVACTGAATCKLGLCKPRGLADAISAAFAEEELALEKPPVIRISGCPNSCANHHIADIGLEGRARRHREKLVPCYDILVSALVGDGQARLAERLGSIPAKKIPDVLRRVVTAKGLDVSHLRKEVKHWEVFPDELPGDYYIDYDDTEAFSLAGRGPGECGAGVMDVIKVDLAEARAALKGAASAENDEAQSGQLSRAAMAAMRALSIVFGEEPRSAQEVAETFTEFLLEPGWVSADTAAVRDKVLAWEGDRVASLVGFADAVEALVARIEVLFDSLDAGLKFTVEPVTRVADERAGSAGHEVDLRGVACPINFVKAKLEMEKLNVGDILEVLLDHGEPERNVPASFNEQGQEVLSVSDEEDYCRVRIKRSK